MSWNPASADAGRYFISAVGLAVCATVFPWLYREFDIPAALRANGTTGVVLWLLFAVAWVGVTLRFMAVKRWADAHRTALLDALRWGGIFHGVIMVALFYLMWALGRLTLGEWPQPIPMHDPKGIFGSAIGYILICLWFWCGPLAVIVPLARAARAWRTGGGAAAPLVDLAATLAFMAIAVAWLRADVNGLMTWFLD